MIGSAKSKEFFKFQDSLKPQISFDDIIVIDDVINHMYQDDLEKTLLSEMSIPWFLLDDITYSNTRKVKKQNLGLVHPIVPTFNGMSPVYNLLLPLLYEALTKIDFKLSNIIQARSFLQFPTEQTSINNPHVDDNIPHIVCLYYVNDSDGDTIIYDQTTDIVPNVPGINEEVFTIKQRVTPKKGRVVLFNGKHYHSSSTPTQGRRCIINFDVE